RTGFTFPLPRFVESNYPLGGEMLAMIGMADASYVGASVANLAVFALCGLGTLCLADRLGDRRAGGAGLLLLLTSSTAVHTLFLQKTDLAVTLFFLACACALLVWRQEGDRRFLVLAGAVGGAALGTKYTAGLFVGIAFALALAGRARDGGGRFPALARDAGLFLLAAAAVFSPWLYRNLAATGNPVYPLLNGIFQSPTWSPARMKVLFEDSHPLSLWLHGWRDVGRLFASATFFPDVNLSSAGASLGASIAAAILFPLVVRKPDARWRFLRALSIALVAAWILSSAITRYLLPALPLMAVLSGALLSRLAGRGGRGGPAAAALLLAAAVGAQAASISAESTLFRAWRGAFALAGHPERASVIASRFDPSYGAARYANARLPGTARVLFLGETRHYWFERDAMVPSPFDEHPLQKIAAGEPDPERVRRTLASSGYTHVLVNWQDWERLGGSYFSILWKKEEIAAADRFARALPAVYEDRAVAILSLETPLRK
ncbi:MAG: glycosyltransferase family 39 protein, partial [Deltaproteobacteria bacterium]